MKIAKLRPYDEEHANITNLLLQTEETFGRKLVKKNYVIILPLFHMLGQSRSVYGIEIITCSAVSRPSLGANREGFVQATWLFNNLAKTFYRTEE